MAFNSKSPGTAFATRPGHRVAASVESILVAVRELGIMSQSKVRLRWSEEPRFLDEVSCFSVAQWDFLRPRLPGDTVDWSIKEDVPWVSIPIRVDPLLRLQSLELIKMWHQRKGSSCYRRKERRRQRVVLPAYILDGGIICCQEFANKLRAQMETML